jgi:osmotically inducible protein OsmC
MKVSIRGQVDGLDAEGFREAAQDAAQNCPVSQALKGNVDISVDASLA